MAWHVGYVNADDRMQHHSRGGGLKTLGASGGGGGESAIAGKLTARPGQVGQQPCLESLK